MTRKEAALLAYEIREFERAATSIAGKDCAMEVANAARQMVKRILGDHPKVAELLEELESA